MTITEVIFLCHCKCPRAILKLERDQAARQKERRWQAIEVVLCYTCLQLLEGLIAREGESERGSFTAKFLKRDDSQVRGGGGVTRNWS